MAQASTRGEPAPRREPRLLLIEFASINQYQQLRTEWFPFVQGHVRSLGFAVAWLTLQGGPAARPVHPFIVEPPADERALLLDALRSFDPTVLLLNEKLGPGLSGALDAALPGVRRFTVGEDTPRYREITVDEVARWLGCPPPLPSAHQTRLISDHGVPDFASVLVNPGAVAVVPYTPIEAGLPCTYVRPIAGNAHYAGVDLSDSIRRVGCAFCAGPFLDKGDIATATPARSATDLALSQIRGFLDTAPAWRRSGRFRVDSASVFARLSRFATGLGDLPLPPSTFYFARRIDEALAHAEELRRALPVFERLGHKMVLWCIGVENFAPDENARMNKGLTVEQIEAALRVLGDLEARHPEAFVFFREAGFAMILFTPWTCIEDLRINVAAMRRLGRLDDSVQLSSRLLLFPGAPITALARHDGLVRDAFAHAMPVPECGFDVWDAREVPWQFRHADVASVFRFAARMTDRQLYVTTPQEPVHDALWHALADVRERLARRNRPFIDVFELLLAAVAATPAPHRDADILAALRARWPEPVAQAIVPPAPRDPALARLLLQYARLASAAAERHPQAYGGYRFAALRAIPDAEEPMAALTWQGPQGSFEVRVARDQPGAAAFARRGGIRVWHGSSVAAAGPAERQLLDTVARGCGELAQTHGRAFARETPSKP